MLTRRHIRIKIVQSVYSFNLNEGRKIDDQIQFFNKSIIDTYNLYILMLSLFKELKTHTKEEILTYEKNSISKDENYIGMNCLANNRVLDFLDNHAELVNQIKNNNFVKWDLEFKFIKRLVLKIIKSENFKTYSLKKSPNLLDCKSSLINLFKDIIAPSPYLYNYIEDQNLSWIADLPVVNTFLLKIFKNLDITDPNSLKFPKPKQQEEDLNFGVKLLKMTISKSSELHNEIEGKTPNWDPDRIAFLDQIILRAAIAELLYFEDIPAKVTLNEYLEIAKDYSTPNSNNFVNGVLDKLVKDFKNENRLTKTGRGLL